MKTTELKFTPLSSFPPVKKLTDKVEEIRREGATNQAELDKSEQLRLAYTAASSRAEDAAHAMLRGDVAEGEVDVPSLETIQRLRERQKILNLALPIGEGALKEAKGKASLEICREVKPQISDAFEELAKRLVATSEQATKILGMYSELDSAGISRSTLPVAIELSALDARNADSRINGWVDAISKDYAVQVKRESLSKAEELRLRIHHEREARKVAERAETERKREQSRKRQAKELAEA